MRSKWPCPTYSFSKILLHQYSIINNMISVDPGWIKTDMGGKSAKSEIFSGVLSITYPIFNEISQKYRKSILYNGKPNN